MKVRAPEAALPGFRTVTLAEPAAAIAEAGTWAVSWVALTKAVASGEPFHCTVAPETKLLPLTVRVKAGLPAVAPTGDRDARVGAAVETVNVRALEEALPGFRTMTLAEPAAVILAAGIWAVSWVALTKVVAIDEPFHCTVEPETKPLPLTVRLNAELPAKTPAGESELSVGAAAATMLKVIGAALLAAVGTETETEALPGVAIQEAATWAVS